MTTSASAGTMHVDRLALDHAQRLLQEPAHDLVLVLAELDLRLGAQQAVAGWWPTQVTASSSSPCASTLRWIRPMWVCFS